MRRLSYASYGPDVRRKENVTLSQIVFVLEDDADILRLVQYHLAAAGFTVRPYAAIGSIVADAERQPPALFLLDIMVPGGDGLDLCRRLRLNPALSVVPTRSAPPTNAKPPMNIAQVARHPGRVFSRDHLLDAVWGDARFVTPRSVDVYVRRIREKIEEDAETPRYLKTMGGAGYRFEIPKKAVRAT